MNVLITGGAGFIGSHLAERCLNEQWNVSVLDDLSTGTLANIAPLRAHANSRLQRGSVFNSELVAELVDQSPSCNWHDWSSR
jgi:UDP-glucose 4-epimerase